MHTLSILQHVSAHHSCHHQRVFVVVIIMLSNGPTYDKWINSQWYSCTRSKIHPWWWHVWCAETCWRIDNLWRLHLLPVESSLIWVHIWPLESISWYVTAVTQWLRCCATNRKAAGSIPGGVSGFFFDIKSFRSHYGPGVDSASNRNDYQEYFLVVKAAGA